MKFINNLDQAALSFQKATLPLKKDLHFGDKVILF